MIIVNLVKTLILGLVRHLPANRRKFGRDLGEVLSHKSFAGGILAFDERKRRPREIFIPIIAVG